ncbi:hypothetical protein BZA77DRAFT_313235 [Pyronema omphalodes]|nr:hypothetical protein BZA77DRAFT_313235 [Pyronema omphalodes]
MDDNPIPIPVPFASFEAAKIFFLTHNHNKPRSQRMWGRTFYGVSLPFVYGMLEGPVGGSTGMDVGYGAFCYGLTTGYGLLGLLGLLWIGY